MIALAILCMVACGKKEDAQDPPSMPSPALLAKVQKYLELQAEVEDQDGVIEGEDCDSAHWNLLRSVGGRRVNARLFMDGDRRLHRRTARYPECYPGRSDSTMSPDMLLFALAYGMDSRDLGLIQDIFSYGKEHSWIMGDGDRARTLMRPNMQGLYARAIKNLGGPDFAEWLLPNPIVGNPSGYEAQLQVVNVLVDACVNGGIGQDGKDALRAQVARQPNNALFLAALSRFDADVQGRAQDALLNGRIWPADRLPTSADRCEQWLTQRDEGADWDPCPAEGHKHSGGDFLFASAIFLDKHCDGKE